MKRFLLFGSLAIMLLLPGPAPVAAQDTGDALAALGLPELAVTITATGFEGFPEELEAGRYLISVDTADDVGEFGGAFDLMLPVGVTAEELVAFVTAPVEEQAAAMHATPDDAAAEGEMGGPPPFLFDSRYAGGIGLMAGQQGQLVVDLPPGEWLVSAPDPEASQAPLVLTVTGEMPADLPEPESDATITMGEYTIEVTEGALSAGRQVVRVDNLGAQPHFIYGAVGPDTMTADDIGAFIDFEMTGTPAATDFDPMTDLTAAFFTGTQSTETTQWLVVDLDPGTYAMLCYFPDEADMLPHAWHGMYTVVEVGA